MENFRKKRYTPPASSMVYGMHPVLEALKSGKNLDKILLKKGMRNDAVREISQLAREKEIPVMDVPIEKLNRMVNGNHQGVLAFMGVIEYQEISRIIPFLFDQGRSPFILVLDRVTDVRNFGAICRTASCAGVDAILFPSRGSAQINEDAVKTSAGALHSLAICRSYNLKESLKYLHDSGLRVIAVTEKGKQDYYTEDLSGPVALLLGSEEDGISPEYLKLSDAQVKIPMQGNIASLNVSVAAGVLMFETVKQRHGSSGAV